MTYINVLRFDIHYNIANRNGTGLILPKSNERGHFLTFLPTPGIYNLIMPMAVI